MRKPYTINNRAHTVPTTWADVTVKEFSAITKSRNQIQLLSGILGYPEKVISSSAPTVFDDITLDLSFISRPIDVSKIPMQKKIVIAGTEYDTPHAIKFDQDYTYGRKVELDGVIKEYMTVKENDKGETEGSFDLASATAKILAIWYFPIITGKDIYDNDWKEVVPMMEALPVIEAYPIASFFLKRAKVLKSYGTQSSPLLQTLLDQARQRERGLTRYMLLACLRLYIHFQKAILPSIVRYTMKV